MNKNLNKILIAILVLTTISINTYGQELRPVKGANYEWGFVDETGNVIIPFIYNGVGEFSEGLARAREGDSWKWGFIDKTGTVIIPFMYGDVKDFSEGLAPASIKKGGVLYWGFIDKTGKVIIPFTYADVKEFSEGFAQAKEISGTWYWGFIDKTGKMITPCIYLYIGEFSEGLARAKNTYGKWGFINKAGNAVISFEYKDAKDFSDGLAQVKINKREWIYIDKTGKEVIHTAMNTDNNLAPEVTNEKQQNTSTSTPNVDTPNVKTPNTNTPNVTETPSRQKSKFGINGGLYYTNEVSKYDGKKNSTNVYLPGFQLGFVGNIPLGKYFALQPSLLYVQQREVEKSDNEYEKRIINHLQIPVNLQLKLGNIPIWLQAGPYIGYALWGKWKWKEEVSEGKFESGSSNIKIGNSQDDEFKPFDIGISSGIALKTNNIQFGLNYNVGLANKSTSDNKKIKEKNNGVSFSATYFFGK